MTKRSKAIPRLHTACVAGLVLATGLAATRLAPDVDNGVMTAAAQAFLTTLDPERRSAVQFSFDGEERLDWHYIPRRGEGLRIREMDDLERSAAHTLMQSALSTQGYLKATSIMRLEDVLREIESKGERDASHRDPELYRFQIFGEPSDDAPWGWRVEGHHLSLTFTNVTNELVATTPAFFGTNPAEVLTGPHAGLRVLAREEDLARALLASFDDGQWATAVIADRAPRDIIMNPGNDDAPEEFAGLAASDMNDAQRKLLRGIIEEFAGNLRTDLAQAQLDRMLTDGLDAIHFAWAGSDEQGFGHYYRVHGPSFVIEYDNVQNGANHVHAVWRDPARDFGRDLLREHRAAHHPDD